jgi:NAD(P)-dependent dehydrogenase (short-subunit alcohol dehydrogenase family)
VRRLVEESGESLDALRPRQPMGRLGTADEVAAAFHLAGEESAFATGAIFTLDGGLTAA